jgi:hypothetical protein
MKTLNIRVYRVVFPDKTTHFATKTIDGRGSTGTISLSEIASVVKTRVERFLNETEELTEVSIDLRPFHDIECPSGLQMCLCLPLTKHERERFWGHFNGDMTEYS